MSVVAINAFSTATGNGATTSFPYTFAARSAAEVAVYVNGSPQTVGITITPNVGSNGGTVLFTTAPANGAAVIMQSVPSLQQSTTFVNAGAYNPSAVDGANDEAAIRDIFLKGLIDRAALVPLGETAGPLPPSASRVGKFFGFDGSGNPIALSGTGNDTALRTDLAAAGGSALVSFRPTGVVGNGVADDRTALATADTIAPLELPAGNYLIGSSVAFTHRVTFKTGAKLTIPTGVTVTFSGGITAPAEQIFACSGTGAVVFNWTHTSNGFLEWWGAKADASAYCDTQWTAAHLALHRVYGQPGDYLFQHLAKIPGPHMGFIGSGGKYTSGTAQATRLLLDSGTENVLQIGPDAYPGSINAMPQGIEVRDFFVGRNVAPAIASNGIGVRVQYVLGAIVERVKSQDSMVEFSFYGTSATKCIDCEASRASAGTGGGTDYWRGFYPDGTAAIGASGGNASLYLIRPSYTCALAALQTGDSIGLNITSAFTDLFIENPEGSSCRDDIVITGDGLSTIDAGNCDLRIDHPTSDQFRRYGISITNLAASGIIQINRPYFGPNPGATASINISGCAGTITFAGGEALHQFSPLVKPINIASSEGVVIRDLGVLEAGNSNAAVTLATIKNCRIAPVLSNKVNTGAVAVAISGTCTANFIAPIVKGKASAFTSGINVTGTADDRNEYNLTGIDSACIASGSANKLIRNAVQIVATGLTGTNLVSGVVT